MSARQSRQHEVDAARQIPFCRRRIERHDPRCLVRRGDLVEGGFNGLDHLRLADIADMAQIGAQVRGADKHRVNAIHCQDIIKRIETGLVFNLHDKAHFIVSRGQIIGMAGKSGGARTGAPDPADAIWRVAHRFHQHFGLGGAFHHRHDQRLTAKIGNLLDDMGLADMRADRGSSVIAGDGLQLCQNRWHIIRRMFGVDQQPVKIGGGGNLGGDRGALCQPAANGLASLFQRLLEAVYRCCHLISPEKGGGAARLEM